MRDPVPILSFNSILVRLKATELKKIDAEIASFNSILVRLKGSVFAMGATGTAVSFNSILVRLKVILKWDGSVDFGSVSIPYWFD